MLRIFCWEYGTKFEALVGGRMCKAYKTGDHGIISLEMKSPTLNIQGGNVTEKTYVCQSDAPKKKFDPFARE